ncbi:MAG: DUF547 domain-containing protein [Candidatus Sumerlaeaceae bacterium]
MRGFVLVASLFVLSGSQVSGQPTFLERSHRAFNDFLRTYVVTELTYKEGKEFESSRVRYGALKRDDRWTSFVESLAKVDSAYLRTADREDRIAFWINTYNALIIDTVIQHYPIRATVAYPNPSIRSIKGAWDVPHEVAGQKYSLSDVEDILGKLGDGRVWFLTCPAAMGGPNLRPYALTPTNIEQELESACGGWVNDPRHVRIKSAANELEVSDYLEDKLASLNEPVRSFFPGAEKYPLSQRALIDTLLRRLPPEKKDYIRAKYPTVVFIPLDWTLNDAASF